MFLLFCSEWIYSACLSCLTGNSLRMGSVYPLSDCDLPLQQELGQPGNSRRQRTVPPIRLATLLGQTSWVSFIRKESSWDGNYVVPLKKVSPVGWGRNCFSPSNWGFLRQIYEVVPTWTQNSGLSVSPSLGCELPLGGKNSISCSLTSPGAGPGRVSVQCVFPE